MLDETKLIDEEVRRVLKALKALGNEAKQQYETHLYIALMLRSSIITRKGEAWHQLALRSVERVDYDEAMERFAKAKQAFDPLKQPLAYARVLRDEAWLTARYLGECERGQELIAEAFHYHERDLAKAQNHRAKTKGRRQELITQTYTWRIEYLRFRRKGPLRELLRVIEHEGHEFCERDQLAIIKFLIPRVGIEERVKLQLRAGQLHSASGSLVWLPYRVAVRGVNAGLSPLRWLTRSVRKE